MTHDPDQTSHNGERPPGVARGASVTILLWNHGPLRLPVIFDPAPSSAPPRPTSELGRGASAVPLLRPARAHVVGASLAALGLLSWLSGRGRTPW